MGFVGKDVMKDARVDWFAREVALVHARPFEPQLNVNCLKSLSTSSGMVEGRAATKQSLHTKDSSGQILALA